MLNLGRNITPWARICPHITYIVLIEFIAFPAIDRASGVVSTASIYVVDTRLGPLAPTPKEFMDCN